MVAGIGTRWDQDFECGCNQISKWAGLSSIFISDESISFQHIYKWLNREALKKGKSTNNYVLETFIYSQKDLKRRVTFKLM